MPKYEKHVFICINKRPDAHPRGCCDATGRGELHAIFKRKVAERGLKWKLRVNQTSCLDQCEHGPVIVVYPEAVWYGNVTPQDVEELIETHIVGGRPLERRVIQDSCLNVESCAHKPRRPEGPSGDTRREEPS